MLLLYTIISQTIILMNFQNPSFFSFLHLSIIIELLVLFQSLHGSSNPEFYATCGNTFTCGSKITRIGYPFRGSNDPPYCGHPSLVLSCDDRNDVTTIDIINMRYHVMEINQTTQIMRIVREDVIEGTCPKELVNTSLDSSIFDYASSYTNLTFLYGCPSLNISGLSPVSCGDAGYDGVYVFAGSQSPGNCNASVVVPVLVSGNEGERLTNGTGLNQVLRQGFEIRWKIGSGDCNDCTESKGRCGYDLQMNRTTCFCPDPPFISDRCSMGSVASPGNRSSTGGPSAQQEYVIIGVSLGSAGIVTFIIFYIRKQRKLQKHSQESNHNVNKFLIIHGSLAPKRYNYREVKKITESFREKLGQGGYGIVYKGKLPDGHLVAVKVLTGTDENGEEFINEVASISRTSHVNIVNLLGFCYERKKRALVYEYMPNKSLDKFICNSGSHGSDAYLEWDKLYDIAVGVARGLEYLHRGCNTRIVHFDIKPQNILLDQDFCPKISDFGLAKLFKKKQSMISMLGTRGTIGYIAPEVFSRNFGGVSHKSDVYSYGMMLLEMAGARKNVEIEAIQSSEDYFPDKIYEHVLLKNKKLDDLMTEENEETARKMLLVGLWCIQTAPSNRPSMTKVLEMLEGSLESIQIPPKPVLSAPRLSGQGISSSFSVNIEAENSAEV